MAVQRFVREARRFVARNREKPAPPAISKPGPAVGGTQPHRAYPDLAGAAALYRSSAGLGSSLELEEVLARAVDHAADALDATGASILLSDGQSGRVSHAAVAQHLRQPVHLQAVGQLHAGQGLTGWVAEHRRGVVVADVERDDRWGWPPGQPRDVRSAICVPLVFDERELVGVLLLTHTEVGHFGDQDLTLLSALAGPVAVAIHNARLYRLAQAARQRADLEKSRLSEVIANLPDGLAMLDRQFRPIVVNAAATRLLGLPSASSTSLPALLATGRLLVQDLDQERFLDLLAASEARPGQPLTAEVTTSPESRRLRLLLSPIRKAKSGLLGMVLVVRDVTKEHEVDRLKDELIANVSHELQTPLASIRACSEMLLDEVDGESPDLRRKLLGIVASESQQLSSFISNMLDLSRLDGGQLRPNRTIVDLRWVAADVVAALEMQARAARIAISLEDEGRPCLALADEQMVGVILNNLLGNAIKYNEPGGHVWLQLRQGRRHALISVVDDGPGIPPEAVPHVFERFYRVRSTTEGSIKGAGLGLALVKGLVDIHGGTIEVESEVGKGTSFRVQLPAPGPSTQTPTGGREAGPAGEPPDGAGPG